MHLRNRGLDSFHETKTITSRLVLIGIHSSPENRFLTNISVFQTISLKLLKIYNIWTYLLLSCSFNYIYDYLERKALLAWARKMLSGK